MATSYKYIRREFLNNAPADVVHTSYVLAHVEASDSGCTSHGSNMLVIADCNRTTKFEFYLGDKAARDSSIAKINLLLEIVSQFRDALLNEAFLIAKVQKTKGARRK
ncbi:MAG TPA: hypothetical protein VFS77_10125 [Pyrinomonadaceae bacterium]|nr:hypothetical protein [Pyrinomonadaceae bacterium]